MRVFVTGASGFVGHAFLQALARHESTGSYLVHARPGLVRLDLTDAGETGRRLAEIEPHVVIHCAARPSVDWCEENSAAARRLNLEATLHLLAACRERGARLVFLSTDYVFDGEAGPYSEEAQVRPINAYGRLKLEAERAILADAGSHLVVRTTNVYGYDPESRNFLMAILPRLARGEKVPVAEDQYGTPVHVEDLCRAVVELVESAARGVVHVVGPDWVDRASWARAAATEFGIDATRVLGARTEQLDQTAPRPRRAGLVSRRLSLHGVAPPRSLAEGLKLMLSEKRASAVQAW